MDTFYIFSSLNVDKKKINWSKSSEYVIQGFSLVVYTYHLKNIKSSYFQYFYKHKTLNFIENCQNCENFN